MAGLALSRKEKRGDQRNQQEPSASGVHSVDSDLGLRAQLGNNNCERAY
jgi:hypothetical protein